MAPRKILSCVGGPEKQYTCTYAQNTKNICMYLQKFMSWAVLNPRRQAQQLAMLPLHQGDVQK